jgi:hypothetical protein
MRGITVKEECLEEQGKEPVCYEEYYNRHANYILLDLVLCTGKTEPRISTLSNMQKNNDLPNCRLIVGKA